MGTHHERDPHEDIRARWGGELDAVAVAARHRPARLGAIRLVGVDGPSGSGKSVLAADLAALLATDGVDVRVLSTDAFATWDRPVQWWPHLDQAVLRPLARGRAGVYLPMDWSGSAPRPQSRPVVLPPCDVLVLEGVSSARRLVADRLSLAIWVELDDPARRLHRAVARDGPDQREHLMRWQRSEQCWFAMDRTRERADMVLTPAG